MRGVEAGARTGSDSTPFKARLFAVSVGQQVGECVVSARVLGKVKECSGERNSGRNVSSREAAVVLMQIEGDRRRRRGSPNALFTQTGDRRPAAGLA